MANVQWKYTGDNNNHVYCTMLRNFLLNDIGRREFHQGIYLIWNVKSIWKEHDGKYLSLRVSDVK